jgi:transposase-like protein
MAETTTQDRSNGVRVRVLGPPVEWTPPRGRARWRHEDGEAMAAAFRASDETVAEFARRHGLHEARVQRWMGRVGRRSRSAVASPPVVFAPVQVAEATTTTGLEVVVGAAVVRVSRGFDGELLRRVVATLGEASC